MAAIGDLQRGRLQAAVEIIAAMGHAEAGLRNPHGVGVRIGGRGRDARAERRVVADTAHQARDVIQRRCRVDTREMRPDGIQPARFDRLLVEGSGIEISDLLFGRALGGASGDDLLDHRADLALGVVGQFLGGAEGRLVGRQLVGREPLVVNIAVEVVAKTRARQSRDVGRHLLDEVSGVLGRWRGRDGAGRQKERRSRHCARHQGAEAFEQAGDQGRSRMRLHGPESFRRRSQVKRARAGKGKARDHGRGLC